MPATSSAFTVFARAQSFAVVGAARSPQKVGHQILRNLLTKPRAKVYPINPHARRILEQTVFPSLTMVKHPIEVVIIATPAATVHDVINEVIDRNRRYPAAERVKGVVIISAGFAETSKAGSKLQLAIATKLALANIHLLGPNSLGYVIPPLRLNASFASEDVPIGNLGIISQSGAMLTLLFDAFRQTSASQNVGVSFAASLGNTADIAETDLLRFAWHDPATRAILLYLESFHDLPSFMELASQVCREKPVILLKGGISERGQRASASHTAALATNQVLLEWAAHQAGCVLVHTIEELVYLGSFLSHAPAQLDTVLVITNAGGPGVNTIDALAATPMQLANWSSHSKESFERLLPSIQPANPLDLLGDASPERFATALQLAQRETAIDSIVVIVTPQAVTDIKGITNELGRYRGKKPLLVSLMGGDHLEKYRQQLREQGLICPPFPNDSVTLLSHAHQATAYRYHNETFVASRPHTAAELAPLRTQRAANTVPTYTTAMKILQSAGIPLPKWWVAHSKNDDFDQLKYPMFAKTANLALAHKAEVGAIYGRVESASAARTAYEKLSVFGNTVVFQTVIKPELEVLIGVERDPQFGMYLTVGMGGGASNLFADRAYAFLPARAETLKRVWHQTKAFQACKEAGIEPNTITTLLQQIQKLIMQHPEISLLEFNPVTFVDSKPIVLDVKMAFGR